MMLSVGLGEKNSLVLRFGSFFKLVVLKECFQGGTTNNLVKSPRLALKLGCAKLLMFSVTRTSTRPPGTACIYPLKVIESE